MIRLGSDLKFDASHCPADSYMRNKNKTFTPMHFDCPTLFIVGARKGGTSSLYQYISKHPDFEGARLDAGPQVGETFYFSTYYKETQQSWDRYISMFPSGGVMTGDSSANYLDNDRVPKRIYKACGNQARIVMLLRDPVKRYESNFLMRAKYVHDKISNGSISTFVKMQLKSHYRVLKGRTITIKNLTREWNELTGLLPNTMMFHGFYYIHLMNWLCNIPAKNILILNSEEFYRNSSKILDYVYQFLGLKRLDSETYDLITSATYNKGKYKVRSDHRLSSVDIAGLLKVFKPFNQVLFELLHWENHQWLVNIDTPIKADN